MNKDRKIIPGKIQVLNIKTIKGNIESSPDADPELINGYKFNHILGTGINAEEKLIGLRLTVDIEAQNEKEEAIGISASYTHNFTFYVENLEEFLGNEEKEGGALEIDPIMVATLVGIAYSTVRGIVYTRTQSTSLNGVILPVIDPKELLKYDNGEVE